MTEPSGWTQVTVYSREDKLTASGKDFVAFTDENGAKWNVFEPTAFAIIQPNNLLKVHWEQKGKFKNVKGLELVEKGATPEPPEPRINTQKQNSIEVQHAVGRTVELWNGGKLDDIPEGPTLKKRVVAYLLGKISGPDAEPQLVDVAKQHGAVDSAEKTAKSIKNTGQLRKELVKLGFETQEEQLNALSLNEFSDIGDDFSGAYMVAWEKANA